jgi:deazaflavin-dependent oxidoreductase (nitroreductase family)
MTTPVEERPNWTMTPTKWMNAAMSTALRMPGLRNVIGKKILLLTFTGHKSGQQYTTPVTYYRQPDGTVLVLTKSFRPWWRNFDACPEVEVVIQGRKHSGTACAQMFGEDQIPQVLAYLSANAQDAKYYGVRMVNGEPNMDDVRAFFGKLIVVTITLG